MYVIPIQRPLDPYDESADFRPILTMQISVRPDQLMPIRAAGGRVEYVSMSNTFSVRLEGCSADEVRAIGEALQNMGSIPSLEQAANQSPGEPPLPDEFQRRLEID